MSRRARERNVNGVSRLHGEVSRKIFRPLFPRWPTPEVPIDHVTNGVDMPTWESAESDAVWTDACTRDRWQGNLEMMEEDLRDVPDAKLWELRATCRRLLIEYVRDRTWRHLAALGAPSGRSKRQKLFLTREPHHRLRKALRDLQAPHPAAPRSGTTVAHTDLRRPARAASS